MAAEYENRGGSKQFGIAQIVFIWIFGIFYSIGFSGLLVAYTLEVLPYHLRAKGVLIMNMTVQAVLAISAQTNPIAITQLPKTYDFWIWYTVRSTFLKPSDVFDDLCSLIRVCVCSVGMYLKRSGFTSSSSRLKAPLSRRSPRSSMAKTLWLISTWHRLRKR